MPTKMIYDANQPCIDRFFSIQSRPYSLNLRVDQIGYPYLKFSLCINQHEIEKNHLDRQSYNQQHQIESAIPKGIGEGDSFLIWFHV